MKKLLILTNEFPYGSLEPYMESEEPYYMSFDKVWIASLQLRPEHAKTRRELKSKAEVIPVKYESRLFYLMNSFTVLGDANLYGELGYLFKTHMFSLSHLVDLFVFLSRAHHEARVVNRNLNGVDKSEILFYSYRFEYQPYVAMLLRKKWKTDNEIFTRAHGYDLYESRRVDNYIPLRKVLLDSLDYVFPCSENGTEYIKKTYGKFRACVETRYLGTQDHGIHEYTRQDEKYNIISCSNIIEIKHIEKIIDALAILNGKYHIKWTHYGNGILMDKMRIRASDALDGEGSTIQYEFSGNVHNKDLMKAYAQENYFVFINASSTEGLPVSLMEAMSFGIPCIATDVGGTREIVNDRNGLLLKDTADAKNIAEAIEKMIRMDHQQYKNMRIAARTDWNLKFNAGQNYKSFIDKMVNKLDY